MWLKAAQYYESTGKRGIPKRWKDDSEPRQA
jgi:hypothetical protein